jgi:hypothetical protein
MAASKISSKPMLGVQDADCIISKLDFLPVAKAPKLQVVPELHLAATYCVRAYLKVVVSPRNGDTVLGGDS